MLIELNVTDYNEKEFKVLFNLDQIIAIKENEDGTAKIFDTEGKGHLVKEKYEEITKIIISRGVKIGILD